MTNITNLNIRELTKLPSPEFYQKPGAEISKIQTNLTTLETELNAAYLRWETLDQIASS